MMTDAIQRALFAVEEWDESLQKWWQMHEYTTKKEAEEKAAYYRRIRRPGKRRVVQVSEEKIEAIKARFRSYYERYTDLSAEEIERWADIHAYTPIPQPTNPGPALPAWKYLPRSEREEFLATGFR